MVLYYKDDIPAYTRKKIAAIRPKHRIEPTKKITPPPELQSEIIRALLDSNYKIITQAF